MSAREKSLLNGWCDLEQVFEAADKVTGFDSLQGPSSLYHVEFIILISLLEIQQMLY